MRRDINEPIIEKKAAAFFLYIAIIQAIFLKFPYSAGVMTGKTEKPAPVRLPRANKPIAPVDNRIDWRILEVLQRQGRISIVELAERVGLSKTPCAERVRKLESRQVVRGYQAVIDPAAVGAGHVAMVQVVMARTNADSLEQFNAAVRQVPQVQCCFMIAGDFDYLMKIRTRDIDEYRALMRDVIANLPFVQQTHTYVVMESVKDSSELPLAGLTA